MATTCTFQCDRQAALGQTPVRVSGTLSLNDVTVQTTPTAVGTFTTASVAADVQRRIYVGASDAASAAVDEGWYEKVAAATFRKQEIKLVPTLNV